MISTVILTHNNAEIIEKALRSVSWADEIIVIDDYSTDKTAEIAAQNKAKIYSRHLENDFAAQRNFGLEKASSGWILFLDSDEAITAELAGEIKKIIDEPGEFTGFYIKRQDYVFGKKMKWGETRNIKLLRLAKKDAGVWRRAVHEVWDIKGEVGQLNYPIDHRAHDNVTEFLDAINRYSSINADYFISQGKISSGFQIVIYPLAKLMLNYVGRLGFMDGTPGIIQALMMSFHSFLTRGKMYLIQHKDTVKIPV